MTEKWINQYFRVRENHYRLRVKVFKDGKYDHCFNVNGIFRDEDIEQSKNHKSNNPDFNLEVEIL